MKLGAAELSMGVVGIGLVPALMAGLRLRWARSWLGLGPDSWTMLGLYGVGLAIVHLVS